MPVVVRSASSRYDFNILKHGDAIEVESKAGAIEMFRRWRNKTGRRAHLSPSREFPTILYFLDDEVLRRLRPARRSDPVDNRPEWQKWQNQ